MLHASVQSGAFLCISARFCAFLSVSVRFCMPKWAAKKHKFVKNSAKMCKKRFYAIPPLVIPPFACHRPNIVPNCSCEHSFEHCDSQSFLAPKSIAVYISGGDKRGLSQMGSLPPAENRGF